MEADVLIAGAGLAGAVVAQRLASGFGLSSVVVERRDGCGGLCRDEEDGHGVLVHRFGPHWLHTSSRRVVDYLSRFTGWRKTVFRVVARTQGRDWSFPINLATYEQLVGRTATEAEMEAALRSWRVPIEQPRNSEEWVVARVGRRLFELFYRGYTRKQWGCEASELDPGACGRIPVRTGRDDRYFDDEFQAVPSDGYTRMIERMLDHPLIRVVTGEDARRARATIAHRHLVWTGRLDECFDHALGPLQWRAVRWEWETVERQLALPAPQVNFPGEDVPFTRRYETRHATGQDLPVTTVATEFPCAPGPSAEVGYAMPRPDAARQAVRYRELAAAAEGLSLVGRLATYANLNMDQVVEAALDAADRLGKDLSAR